MRALVIIPTYDEVENLAWIVGRVRTARPGADVLVVDDASPDGTGDVADQLAAIDAAVHVLHGTGKAGLGVAYVEGFSWAVGHGYDVVVEMDADGSHQPEQLDRLLDALGAGADLVLGSRWVPGGRVVNWSWSRRLLSRAGNLYARLLLGVPLRDVTGGFRAFGPLALEKIDLASVESQGYCFQIDLALRAWRSGLEVVEVPIEFVERERGTSKMSGAVALESLRRVTVWGLRDRWEGLRRQARGARR